MKHLGFTDVSQTVCDKSKTHQKILVFFFFQNYPVYELSSFIFFLFPLCILLILYIRMGLKIRETSGIQRNLAQSSRNTHPEAPNHLSNSNNSLGPCGTGLRLNVEDVVLNQERQLNAAKRNILRMLGKKTCADLI